MAAGRVVRCAGGDRCGIRDSAALVDLAEARGARAGRAWPIAGATRHLVDPGRCRPLPRRNPVRDRPAVSDPCRAAAAVRLLTLILARHSMRLKLLTLAMVLAAISLPSHGEDLLDAYREARANDPVLSQADANRLAIGEGV